MWSKKAKATRKHFSSGTVLENNFSCFHFLICAADSFWSSPEGVFHNSPRGHGTPCTECLRHVAKGTSPPLFP